MSDLDQLKTNLQEDRFPFFQDAELTNLLEQYGTIQKASYEGCLMKAYNMNIDLGIIKIADNKSYWLSQARRFKSASIISMKRADDCV